MKRQVLRRALGIYLALLIASWLLAGDRPEPLPSDEDWQEVAIAGPGQGESEQAPLRYRKFSGKEETLAPVLLIHGSPLASDSFNSLLQTQSFDRTFLAPDLPGFGHSKYGFSDHSFDAHTAALKQLLEAEAIEKAHLVAYSQGGGPALKLLSSMPHRIASLTLLSSVGVLEHELTGDYFLNQLLYSGQLFFFRLLDWGVPHFGLLDECLLNPRYAENLYYSDMRPLRTIMESVEKPVLILHSQSDWLVPKSAALEHFRILPQSSIHWGRGGHGMLMSQPKWVSDQLRGFFAAVEQGTAPTRADASKMRVLEAAKDFQEMQRMPSGLVLCITLFALCLGTLVSEDLTCITAGLLAARGLVPLSFAMPACFFGIWVGDMMLYALGRYGGGRLLSRWPLRTLIAPKTIKSTRAWLNRRGSMAVFASRFMPGTRLPLYLTAGLVRANVFKMMLWLALAGLLWAFPVVALVAYLGQGFSEWLTASGKFMLPGALLFLLAAFLFTRLFAALLTFEGRRKLFASIQRVKRWEFWPPGIFYIPVALALTGTVLRKGKPFAFTCCNPGMPHSGLVGESKAQILDNLSASGCVLGYLLIPGKAVDKLRLAHRWIAAKEVKFPMVIKPDQGERGKGVKIVNTHPELEAELQKREDDTLLQMYADGLEFGIFYMRYPGEANGSIVSLTRKIMVSVEGDGRSTLKELILKDSRAVLSYRHFFRAFRDQLLEVPEAGQRVKLATLGSHCRGALFLDGADLITPKLEKAIDRIAKHFKGFYLGRFDIRCPSESDLKQGINLSVIELNGVTSEPTHIYHPHTPLRIGLKTVIQQWQNAHEIGLMNIDRGAPVTSFRELFVLLSRT